MVEPGTTDNLSAIMNGRINTKPKFFLLLLSLIFGGQTPVFSDELRDGNVLIAEIRGEVNFRSQNGSPLKAEDFKPGSLLPVGYQVLTGKILQCFAS